MSENRCVCCGEIISEGYQVCRRCEIKEMPLKMARAYNARDQTAKPRRYYSIEPNDDGTVDVYLAPELKVYHTDIGIQEYDIEVSVVKGVIPWDGIEDDIRERYDAWCESATRITI